MSSVWNPGTGFLAGIPRFVADGEVVNITVPFPFLTIQAAVDYISDWVILGQVNIIVKNGNSYNFDNLIFQHVYGQNVNIITDAVTSQTATVFNFTGDGIIIPAGYQLGKISGMTLKKSGAKANFGLCTNGGKILQVGPNIVIDGFYYPLVANLGGWINANGTDDANNRVEVKNGGDVGIWAIERSFITCEHAWSHNNADATNPGNILGGGVVAEFSSGIIANFVTVTDNLFCGIASQSGSAVRAWTHVNHRNGHGVRTASKGSCEVFGSTIDTYNFYAHFDDGDGGLYGMGASTVGGGGLGLIKDPFYIAEDTSVHIDSGSLTLNAGPENVTGSDAFFDVNVSTGHLHVQRYLVNGAEVWRKQYASASQIETWGGGGHSSLFHNPLTGTIAAGRGNQPVNATDGYFQIPQQAGPATVAPTVVSGYVPITVDVTNKKIGVLIAGVWYYTPALT